MPAVETLTAASELVSDKHWLALTMEICILVLSGSLVDVRLWNTSNEH